MQFLQDEGMNFREKVNIVGKAIERYGKKHQMMVAVEEMSELQKEICKIARKDINAGNIEALTEEMADVRLMLFELQMIFGIKTAELDVIEMMKLERLQERMIKDDLI